MELTGGRMVIPLSVFFFFSFPLVFIPLSFLLHLPAVHGQKHIQGKMGGGAASKQFGGRGWECSGWRLEAGEEGCEVMVLAGPQDGRRMSPGWTLWPTVLAEPEFFVRKCSLSVLIYGIGRIHQGRRPPFSRALPQWE